jgi:hypothetical protein
MNTLTGIVEIFSIPIENREFVINEQLFFETVKSNIRAKTIAYCAEKRKTDLIRKN